MSKKGMTVVEIIIWLGIAAFVGFILLKFFSKTSAEAGTLFSSETLKARDAKCELDTQRSEITLNSQNDRDGDGRLDSCDICVCKGSCKKTDDDDLDGMPKGCDKDDNDRTVVGCNFVITKDNRCVEGAPPAQKVG